MFDHSNCGIGAIANLDGTYSHNIIEQGMTLLKALSHRGGTSKDGTGDVEFYYKFLHRFMRKGTEFKGTLQ